GRRRPSRPLFTEPLRSLKSGAKVHLSCDMAKRFHKFFAFALHFHRKNEDAMQKETDCSLSRMLVFRSEH
ncbi:MAG: hypothetical protein IJR87_07850, partial [Bacteroidaceae bacterium]|nr:hypothetical protein [Bacteroidaceae bacterium]